MLFNKLSFCLIIFSVGTTALPPTPTVNPRQAGLGSIIDELPCSITSSITDCIANVTKSLGSSGTVPPDPITGDKSTTGLDSLSSIAAILPLPSSLTNPLGD
ncbi:hypothetical protein C8R44DRAFT_854770 [Mycena epipterygia]|nr:hypothetical protein C8R44DRAFT_854770 [Mycena epipterygia]